MGGNGELQGPDLASGIPLDRIPEDEPFAAHADEEQLILVRRGGEVFAIGGTCTHYGGPLAEGLLNGDEVMCPWHHACFSIRTGEATGAPALDPVGRRDVAVENGTVYVREPLEHDAGQALEATPASVVVVGAGAAGTAAVVMLRQRGYRGSISLVDPAEDEPVDRPNLSKDYLAGDAPDDWIPLRPDGYWDEHDVDRIFERATRLDPVARELTLEGGRALSYDALLLATGAAPVRPDIPGSDLPHVHTLRTLGDARAIIDAAEDADHAVVLGASFIGMEVAASLRGRDVDVTVVAPESLPFEKILGEELGRLLRRTHEENGVSFRLGHTAARISPETVTLDDGTDLPAGLVVVGIGVRPVTDLAVAAGLEVADGVIVDESLRTSAHGIWAAGDSARYRDPRRDRTRRIEHWVVAERQGQTAARNILGEERPFDDVPFFWTAQHGVRLRYVGSADEWDEVRIDGDPADHDCAVRYLKDGELLAVATIGRDREAMEAEQRLAGR